MFEHQKTFWATLKNNWKVFRSPKTIFFIKLNLSYKKSLYKLTLIFLCHFIWSHFQFSSSCSSTDQSEPYYLPHYELLANVIPRRLAAHLSEYIPLLLQWNYWLNVLEMPEEDVSDVNWLSSFTLRRLIQDTKFGNFPIDVTQTSSFDQKIKLGQLYKSPFFKTSYHSG